MRAAAVILALALGADCFAPAPTARTSTALNAAGHAVIVQNKGGGHGEIGYHLAKNLADKDLTVTIVQDSAAKKEALPFSKYGELPSSVNVEWVDTSDASAVEAACGDKATHVFDNNSKKPSDASPIIAAAKKSDAFYSFVSSAGMYAAKGMLKEEKKVKDPPTGQREVEICVEINQCVGCSFLGDDAAVLAPSSGEEPASLRHRAGVASMAWRTTRCFSTNAP